MGNSAGKYQQQVDDDLDGSSIRTGTHWSSSTNAGPDSGLNSNTIATLDDKGMYTPTASQEELAQLAAGARGNVRSPPKGPAITCDEALEKAGFGPFQIVLLFTCGVAWMTDAMEVMLLSFLLNAVKDEFQLTTTQDVVLGSVVFTGQILGSYVFGIMSDRKGRRFGYMFTCFFTAVFGLLSAFAPNYEILVITRGLTGFGLGGAVIPFGLFTEFLPSHNRGVYLVAFEVFWTVGAIGEAGLAWAVMPTLGWRWLVALSSVPMFFMLALYPFLPESPRYHLVTGQIAEAVDTIRDVAKKNHNTRAFSSYINRLKSEEHLALTNGTSDADAPVQEVPPASPRSPASPASPVTPAGGDSAKVALTSAPAPAHVPKPAATTDANGNPVKAPVPEAELHRDGALGPVEIPSFTLVAHKSTSRGKISDLFAPSLRLTTILLWGMWFSVALTYYGLVLFTVSYFEKIEGGEGSQYVDVFISSGAELPGILLGGYLVDKLGRKKTTAFMFLGCFMSTLCLLLPTESVSILTTAAVCSRMFIMGAFSTIYAYTPEVYPTSLRTTGLGACASASKVGATLSPVVAEGLIEISFTLPIVIYACFSGIASLFAFSLPVETAGKDLADEVDDSTGTVELSKGYPNAKFHPSSYENSVPVTPGGTPLTAVGTRVGRRS